MTRSLLLLLAALIGAAIGCALLVAFPGDSESEGMTKTVTCEIAGHDLPTYAC